MFEQGQKVKVSVLDKDGNITGYRLGTVGFRRYGNYTNEVVSYSVILYDQLNRSNYEGSIFPADRVFKDE